MQKTATFNWGSDQQEAFEILKQKLCSEPILFLPIDDGPFRIETDCSQYAMGGILSQYIEGKWRPIAYRSQSLSEAERNYEIHDRELLSIMEALKDWRQYLLGAQHRVEVWMDHLNLTYFRQPNKLNRRQARWHTELQSYDLLLVHKPGALMRKADILSRIDQLDKGKDDNSNETILSEKMFARPAVIFNPSEDQLTKIKENYTKQDPSVKKALEEHKPGWREYDCIVTFQEKIYVPKDESLRGNIVKTHHDSPTAGHPGNYKTLELVARSYFWPGMSREVKKYVQGCDVCQRTKVERRASAAPLQPHLIPDRPWSHISMDLIGPLPTSQGKDAILVVVD